MNSRIQWVRKCIKSTVKQTAREMMKYTSRIWWKSTGAFFRREEQFLKKRIWAQPSDEEDDRDRRSRLHVFSRIVAINSWAFDQRWRAQIDPRFAIGNDASSDLPLDFNPTILMCLMSPLIACNLSRYKSSDRRSRLTHLSELLITCTNCWSVDRASTASTPRIPRDLYPTLGMLPRVLQSNENKWNSPTRRNLMDFVGYIRYTILCG